MASSSIKRSETTSNKNLICTVMFKREDDGHKLPTMRRNMPSSSLYGIFTVPRSHPLTYVIYKFLEVEGKSSVQPIQTLPYPQYPIGLNFFSVGTKFYFCGGIRQKEGCDTYDRRTYVFDTSLERGVVAISSMHYPKPNPLVIGPINDAFYLLNSSDERFNEGKPSFEKFNTLTHRWKCLSISSSFEKDVTFDPYFAFHGTNILISTISCDQFYVYYTENDIWRKVDTDGKPYCLPFSNSIPLFLGLGLGKFFLTTADTYDQPKVYVSSPTSPVGNFRCLGEVEGLCVLLPHWGGATQIFLGKNDTIGVVSYANHYESDKFVVTICDVKCVREGRDRKVHVVQPSVLQYKIQSNVFMRPNHFLVA